MVLFALAGFLFPGIKKPLGLRDQLLVIEHVHVAANELCLGDAIWYYHVPSSFPRVAGLGGRPRVCSALPVWL